MSVKRTTLFLVLVTVTICFLSSFQRIHAQVETTARFEPSACPFNNITAIRIDCGWLTVPEDHANPTGATIRLAVAIIRATGSARQPDPVIYLAGGPGAGVVWMAPRMAVSLAQSTRDMVLIDQRGMGLSEPGLYCPAISEWMILSNSPIEAEISACRAELTRKGVHPEFYTTVQNAADIAAVRLALGYRQVNLFGVSYGTRLALTILRDFPDGLRSVTLDSTHPPQVMYGEDTDAINSFERSFGVFEALCTADLICRTAYPNLRATYLNAYDRLNRAPVTVTVDSKPYVVNGALFETMVFNRLYRPASLATLPALIYATANGDQIALREAVKPLIQPAAGQGRSLGVTLTILCTENAALAGFPTTVSIAAFADPLPAVIGASAPGNCRAWGITAAQRPAPAVNDTVPVFIAGGVFDPVTNPSWGELAAKTLSKAVYVRFPNLGHGITDSECGGAIYARFLDNPTATLNTSCAANIALPLRSIVTAPARRYSALARYLP